MKIAPGVKLNVGKRGASVSIGGRGKRLTVGSSGTRITTGIPGTGVSYTQKIDTKGKSQRSQTSRSSLSDKSSMNASSSSAGSLLTTMAISLKNSDNGELEFTDSDGNILSPALKKLAVQQHHDTIREFIRKEAENWNQALHEIFNIHVGTPSPQTPPVYIPTSFDLQKPSLPTLNKPGFLERMVKSKREAAQQKNEALQQQYEADLKLWEQEFLSHEETEKHRKWLIEEGRYTTPENMQELLEYIFSRINFPRETLLSFQVETNGKAVMIDVDLPEIEDIPTELATVAKNGMNLSIKKRSQTQTRKDYMDHIHGIAFRIIGLTYAALPTVEKVLCSGYSQRLDNATGRVNDEYLFSIRVGRQDWETINFENLQEIDLPACFEQFDIRRKMTKTGIFTAIIPYDSVV